MLIYHPSSDANHCAYRIISILYGTNSKQLPVDVLRLTDFYYLFPFQLNLIKPMPRGFSSYKNDIKKYSKQFESLINPKRVFYELCDVQTNTLIFLLSKGMIDENMYNNKIIKLNIENIPSLFLDKINEDNFRKSRIYEFLISVFIYQEFNGRGGIKDRSGLMEYLYDQ